MERHLIKLQFEGKEEKYMILRKIYKSFVIVISIIVLSILGISLYMNNTLPDSFYIIEGQELSINSKLKIKASKKTQDMPIDVYSSVGNSYPLNLSTLGGIKVKDIQVQVVQRELVVPGGTPFGIKMFTKGVMVVGMSDFYSQSNMINPSKESGIKVGDIIISINQKEINSNDDMLQAVSENIDKNLNVVYSRKGVVNTTTIIPQINDMDQKYKIGMWVRDSSAGIGTMTFFDPQTKLFAGLGHAVCDVDTGQIMPLQSGEIVPVNITGYVKGESGYPGELKGKFTTDVPMGNLYMNNQMGVYGTIIGSPNNKQAIPLALKHEIKEGNAKILTTLEGNTPEYYDIFIEKINYSDASPTKNMVIKITDPRLLSKTGGIVQGMSGSPIIQNDMLIGAVTHVFVNDPTKGYAIFSENMYKNFSYMPSNGK